MKYLTSRCLAVPSLTSDNHSNFPNQVLVSVPTPTSLTLLLTFGRVNQHSSKMAGNKRRRTNGGGFRTTEDGSTSVPFPSSSSISTSQPTFLSTFDRESRYPIFRALCAYLSVSQIVSLTRTCKKLSGLYQYLLPIQWDVDKALLRWVDDPLGFRSQMARCDALIDGDFSFHYFERIQMERGPLDVSIQQGFRVELFSKYLLDIAGYLEVKRKKHGRNVEVLFYTMISVSGIFAKTFAMTGPDLQEHGQP